MKKNSETTMIDSEPVRILAAELAVTPNEPLEMRAVTYTRPFGPLEWGDAHQ